MNESRKLRTKRVSALELVVRRTPYLYGAYTIRSRVPFKKGYQLKGDDSDAVEACEVLGENSRLDLLCRFAQFSLDSYGYCGFENVFWSKNKPVDPEKAYCAPIDPKYLDYQRDRQGKIELNPVDGKPAGYTFSPLAAWGRDSKNLDRSRVAFDVLNPFGGWEPYTLTDVLYDVATYIANNNKNMAHWASTKAFPTLKVRVGTPEMPPTTSQFNTAKSEIEDLETHSDFLVTSGITEIDEIDVGNVRDIIHINDPFIHQVTSVTGIPKPILLGAAEGTELSTSRSQIAMMMDAMEDLQYLRGRFIEDQIFKPFCELHGYTDVPSVKWHPIDEDAIIDIAKAARYLVGMRFEQPMVALKEIRKILGKSIPMDELELEWDGESWQEDPRFRDDGGKDD